MLTIEQTLKLLTDEEKEMYDKLTPRAKKTFKNFFSDILLVGSVCSDTMEATYKLAEKYKFVFETFEPEELGTYMRFTDIYAKKYADMLI